MDLRPRFKRRRVFQNARDPERDHSRGAQFLALIGFVGLPLLVQLAAISVIARDLSHWFLSLRQPPGLVSPQLFAILWAVAGSAFGCAAWLVWRKVDPWRLSPRPALRLWAWLVGLLAVWPSVFFCAHAPGLALLLPLLLALVGGATLRAFWRRDRISGALLLPPLVWLCYGAYLNLGFWWLSLSPQ